jgi:hypothetical protein
MDDGVAIIQYADDTIFMFEDDFESARNLKLILCIFEQLTGLKINFNKSEVSCFGKATDSIDMYARIFTCKVGMFPFRYLGVPMHFKKLANVDWKDMEDKVEKKTACWKGGLNSIGGRLICWIWRIMFLLICCLCLKFLKVCLKGAISIDLECCGKRNKGWPPGSA